MRRIKLIAVPYNSLIHFV